MIAALIQNGGSVSILGRVGTDGHGLGLYPHHEWLSLEGPDLFSEVLVCLIMTRDYVPLHSFIAERITPLCT